MFCAVKTSKSLLTYWLNMSESYTLFTHPFCITTIIITTSTSTIIITIISTTSTSIITSTIITTITSTIITTSTTSTITITIIITITTLHVYSPPQGMIHMYYTSHHRHTCISMCVQCIVCVYNVCVICTLYTICTLHVQCTM